MDLKPGKVVLVGLIGLGILVLVGSSIGHGHWFKCNDVIMYGVWQWCASDLFFRYTQGRQDYETLNSIYYNNNYDSDDDEFMENNLICRDYGDRMYLNKGGVPGPIIVGRVFILLTNLGTVACLGCYFAAFGDKVFGPMRGILVLAATAVLFACYSVFTITTEAYLDSQETQLNRTVVCWNGIVAWIGWCLCFIQLAASFIYFRVDDGEVDELPMMEDRFSNRGGLPGYVGGGSIVLEQDDFYDGRQSRQSRQMESRGYNPEMYS